MFTFFSNLLTRLRKCSYKHRPAPRVRLVCEALEDRSLPAVNGLALAGMIKQSSLPAVSKAAMPSLLPQPAVEQQDLANRQRALDRLQAAVKVIDKLTAALEVDPLAGRGAGSDPKVPGRAASGRAVDELRGALRAAGISEDVIGRLFGKAAGSKSTELGYRPRTGDDQTGLAGQPGWADEVDLMSYGNAAGFRSGLAGLDDAVPGANAKVVKSEKTRFGWTFTYDDGTEVTVNGDNSVTFYRPGSTTEVSGDNRKITSTVRDESGSYTVEHTLTATGTQTIIENRDSAGRTVRWQSYTRDDVLQEKSVGTMYFKDGKTWLHSFHKTHSDGTREGSIGEYTPDGWKDVLRYKWRPTNDDYDPSQSQKNVVPIRGWFVPRPGLLAGGLADPSDESFGGDFDMDRFIRSLVAHLQSKVNPRPDAPAPSGGDTAPGGLPGGHLPDPVDDMPLGKRAPRPKTGPNPVPPLPPGARSTTASTGRHASRADQPPVR